ncbi:MAG TPA: 3'-5' exonuclease [Casimicrobium sp.]|nr:3'-5' exonuclease [Casimicrobium sp.]
MSILDKLRQFVPFLGRKNGARQAAPVAAAHAPEPPLPQRRTRSARPLVPTKEQIDALPAFVGLRLDQIEVPVTAAQAAAAAVHLLSRRFVGFDTESKPTFAVGETSTGPHVVQFSTLERAFIFQVHRTECREALMSLLQSKQMVKVGFGLRSDRGHIQKKFGVQPGALLDMTHYFKQVGHRNEVGVKSAVAMVLQQRFQKSKRISTTNWSNAELTSSQLLYAANDAYGAIAVLHALHLPEKELPITK